MLCDLRRESKSLVTSFNALTPSLLKSDYVSSAWAVFPNQDWHGPAVNFLVHMTLVRVFELGLE